MNELEKAIEINIIINELSSMYVEDASEIRIKNAILIAYNSLESLMNLFLSHYYFGVIRESSKDKVNHFWINILADLNFTKKVKIIEETNLLTSDITDILYKINDIRNDLAHYPHRTHKRKNSHLKYEGKNIFRDIEALRKLNTDFHLAFVQLHNAFKSK